MAHPSTLYRFRIDLADIDRGIYEKLDIRVAMHPSESSQFLLTRVIAFALNTEDGLEFSPGGLSDPDQPALQINDPGSGITVWIEIGSPSAKKLHRAAKTSRLVKVYTYKDPGILLKDIAVNKVYHAERIEVFSLAPKFLDRLGETLARDNLWNLIYSDGSLTLSVGEFSETVELERHSVARGPN